jgi:hypothetical protein
VILVSVGAGVEAVVGRGVWVALFSGTGELTGVSVGVERGVAGEVTDPVGVGVGGGPVGQDAVTEGVLVPCAAGVGDGVS